MRAATTSMSDQELLNMYFECGGHMTSEGFAVPSYTSSLDGEILNRRMTMEFLRMRESGTKLIWEIHDKFLLGEIDEYGKPIETPGKKKSKGA